MKIWLLVPLLSMTVAGCGAPVATCDSAGDCPGRLVCDVGSGLCALPADHDDEAALTPREPSDGDPADDEPADDEPADDERADDEPADDEPADDEPADDGQDARVDDGQHGQCIEEGDDCDFQELGEQDGCCERFHCCPVFRICVPNFWE